MAETKSKRTVEVVLKVVDEAEKAIEATSNSLKKLSKEEKKADKSVKELNKSQKQQSKSADKLAKTTKKVSDSTEKLGKTSKKTKKDVSDLGKELNKTGKSAKTMSKDMVDGLGDMAADFGTLAASLGTIAAPVISFAGFERAMAEVGAIAGATSGELEKLTVRAKELGSTTEFTSSQVASGMKYLFMAGLSVQQSYEAIEGVLDIALIGSLELGQAADIATNILTGFGKSASELSSVNDVLVEAFTSTNSTLEELGTALTYVGPIASGLGADFNDLVSALGHLHNAGLKGSLAGTTLRGVLDTLFNPTKDEAEQLKVLGERIGGVGLELTNAEGGFVGFVSLIEQLEQSGISAAESLSLFGQRAGPGIAALLNQGSKSLDEMNKRLSFADAEDRAGQLAKEIGDNLVGAFRNLVSAMEGFMIRVGNKLAPTIESIAKSITNTVKSMNTWMDINPGLTGTISKVTGSVIALVAALKALKLMSMAATFLTPSMFTGAGLAAGAGFLGSFTSVIATGIKTFLPTLAALFVGGGGMLSGIGGMFSAIIGTITASLSSLFSVSLPAVFSSGGLMAAGAFAATFMAAVAAAFGGFKFGQLIEPWISSFDAGGWMDQTVGEYIQLAIAVIDKSWRFMKIGWYDAFYLTPKLALIKMYKAFVGWISDIISIQKRVPGLGKLLGWADEKTGLTKTLDEITKKAGDMGKQLIKERGEMYDANNKYTKSIDGIIKGIRKEGNARKDTHIDEKKVLAEKKQMYADIESINKEFDPGIEKAQAELKNFQKQFLQLQGVVRTTSNSARDILASIGKNTANQVADLFAKVNLDRDVDRWVGALSRLNREYLTESEGTARRIRVLENRIGDSRVAATTDAMSQSLALIEAQTQRQIDVEQKAHATIGKSKEALIKSEEKLRNKITQISAEGAEAKKQVYIKASEAIQREIDRSITKERQLADELKELKNILKDAISGIESDQRTLRRELMGPAEAYRDSLKEVSEVMKAGDRLSSAGKTKEAVAKWKEAADLAKATAKEVKSGDTVIISKSEAISRALGDMEIAEKKIANVGGTAVKETAKQLASQKQHTDAVKANLDAVKVKMAALDQLTQEGIKIKIQIDLRSFDREMRKLLSTKEAYVTVGAKVEGAQQVLSTKQEEKLHALQTQIVDKYGEMANASQDYANASKNAMVNVVDTAENTSKKLAKQKIEWNVGDIITNENFEAAMSKMQSIKEQTEGVSEIPLAVDTEDYDRKINNILAETEAQFQETEIEPDLKVPDQFVEDVEAAKTTFDDINDKTVTLTLKVAGISLLARAKSLMDSIRSKTVTLTTIARTVEKKAGGGLTGFSRLVNPLITRGGGAVDDVKALLKRDEFVLQQSAVYKFGTDFLYALNNGILNPGLAQGFANGGSVANTPASFQSNGSGNTGSMTVNLNLPGMGRTIPAQMNAFDIDELIGQIKNVNRMVS